MRRTNRPQAAVSTSPAGLERAESRTGPARQWRRWLAPVALVGLLTMLAGCDRNDTVQRGYRGLGTVQMYDPGAVAALTDINRIPAAEEPADPDSPTVDEVFKNVKVLNDLSATEFSRLMQALSTWIAPEEGCDYCHNPESLESDEKYTKVVARRMLEMTRQINTRWKSHVGETGVTCWTCHRGEAVPSGDWFAKPGPHGATGQPSSMSSSTTVLRGNRSGQNMPAEHAGNSSLPYDPLSAFLTTGNEISVQGTTALASGNRHSIKQAEWTYSLMMYMSQSLGVNCTYCHNTRSMGPWEQSTPQRVTAWHGIRLVRDLNTAYLTPLTPLFPANRLSPEGDGPKVGCATCHKGSFKPLYGVSSLKDYPVLGGVMSAAAASSPASAAADASAGNTPAVDGMPAASTTTTTTAVLEAQPR